MCGCIPAAEHRWVKQGNTEFSLLRHKLYEYRLRRAQLVADHSAPNSRISTSPTCPFESADPWAAATRRLTSPRQVRRRMRVKGPSAPARAGIGPDAFNFRWRHAKWPRLRLATRRRAGHITRLCFTRRRDGRRALGGGGGATAVETCGRGGSLVRCGPATGALSDNSAGIGLTSRSVRWHGG